MIYLKIINGIPTPAPADYQDDTGYYPAFNQNVGAMEEKGYLPYDEGDYSAYCAGMKLFVDGEFVENTTPEYIEAMKAKRNENILAQIKDIQVNQLPRAFFEPSIKDKTTGETWLDFYNNQITELRTKIQK